MCQERNIDIPLIFIYDLFGLKQLFIKEHIHKF